MVQGHGLSHQQAERFIYILYGTIYSSLVYSRPALAGQAESRHLIQNRKYKIQNKK